jgi:N6-adenosine-specific RNA methylase IME4
MRYLLQILENQYHTILVDPPWFYKSAGIKRPMHYDRMTTQEIIDMKEILNPIIAKDFCHLWLWTTNPHLPEAFEVMKEWGFTYKSMVTWVKPQMGLGIWLRSVTEHLLFGVIGNKRVQLRKVTTAIFADRTKYCKKPEKAYEIIETLSFPPRLEIFAVQKREGWTSMIKDIKSDKNIGEAVPIKPRQILIPESEL